MITIQGQKKTKLRLGKKMTETGTKEHFVDFTGVDVPASTPDEVKDWIYSDRMIAHQRLRDSMSVEEYNSILDGITEKREGLPVLKVGATVAGQKIETEASRMAKFEMVFATMPAEFRKAFLEKQGK